MKKMMVPQNIQKESNGEAAEVKSKSENVNSSNNDIRLTLLDKILKKYETLEMRIRVAITEELNGKIMESGKQPENKIRQKYRRYGLKNMEKNKKAGKNTSKIINLMKPGDKNENEMMKNNVKYNGEEDDKTRESQL